MGRIALVMALALVLVLAFASVASAHKVGPCDSLEGNPGNSGYAEHHIVAFAHDGDLGRPDGLGHKPGAHRGFSACNPSGR